MRKRFIEDETCDQIVEWVFCNAPCVIDIPGFVNGLLMIADVAIGNAVEAERSRTRHAVLRASRN